MKSLAAAGFIITMQKKVASILVEILFPLIYQFIAILFILCYR
jgi:hypothetical protein